MSDLRCSECGRCVSYHDPDVMAYTLYGTQYDTKPPDPVYICGPCWDGLTDEAKALIARVAWMGKADLWTWLRPGAGKLESAGVQIEHAARRGGA